MKFDLFQYLFALGIFYIYGRTLLHYGLNGIQYMLNQKYIWKNKLEKPRILFLLVGLVFMHLMLYAHTGLDKENYLALGITLATFGLAFFLAQMTWTEKFESTFLSQKHLIKRINKNSFNIRASDNQMEKLYNELVKYDLLFQDKTSFLDFKNVLTRKWDSHRSRIYFNLDGPSCREFYYHLVKTFPNNSLTLKSFFETSELIFGPNGNPYKYNTVKNAPTRTPVSKQNAVLNKIFEL